MDNDGFVIALICAALIAFVFIFGAVMGIWECNSQTRNMGFENRWK
jgi:hypothetical protein